MSVCARCTRTARRIVVAYWGPRLCPDCAQTIARRLDETDRWPPVPDDVIPASADLLVGTRKTYREVRAAISATSTSPKRPIPQVSLDDAGQLALFDLPASVSSDPQDLPGSARRSKVGADPDPGETPGQLEDGVVGDPSRP